MCSYEKSLWTQMGAGDQKRDVTPQTSPSIGAHRQLKKAQAAFAPRAIAAFSAGMTFSAISSIERLPSFASTQSWHA
jgi:hypothetical protein